MAYYSIFPQKDTTLYSNPDRDAMNTGNDDIIELVKEKGSNDSIYYPSRILIKFSDDDIKTAIDKTNKLFTSSLQLFSTEHKNLSQEQLIEVFSLYKSWDEGTGRYSNLPTSSNGASWIYRDNSTAKTQWLTSSFDAGTTGSINDSTLITKGGGEWYTGDAFKGSQSFSNADLLDLNVDVTSIVNQFSSSLYNTGGGISNHGFIIKNSDYIEENVSSSNGELQYFSSDTHTIYPPKLTFKWDDSDNSYTDPSVFNIKTSGELNVSLYRNKKEYNQNDEALIRLNIRDKYPNRSFVTSSNYLDTGYFTTASYYSIRDAHTEEVVIPFDDNCTKLSADSEGMYFKLYINGLQPERYYRILFKHVNNDGTQIYDDNYHFKVIR